MKIALLALLGLVLAYSAARRWASAPAGLDRNLQDTSFEGDSGMLVFFLHAAWRRFWRARRRAGVRRDGDPRREIAIEKEPARRHDS